MASVLSTMPISYSNSMKMKPRIAAAVSLLLALATTTGAVTFNATNTATGTIGGLWFDAAVGLDYANLVLSNASTFIWSTFDQTRPADRKPVDTITLVVADVSGAAAFTAADVITLSAPYVGNYSGDVKIEVTGVLFHETAHVWQWDGQGHANGGLVEGVADFVRLKASYAPAHWAKPGQGYDVTARFLDYCDSLTPGFVALLNAKMKDGYTDDLFAQIMWRSVQQLWQDYKANYA